MASVTGRETESMPPSPASLVIALARRAITLAASWSESAPQTWAAAISPWEWPSTAAGCTPQLAPEAGEGDHHREEGGLDDVEAIKPAALLFAQDLL